MRKGWIFVGVWALALGLYGSRTTAGGSGRADALGDLGIACVGGGLIVYGFMLIRKERLIENIPRSRIRSVAMGLAEISGRARQETPLMSPHAGLPCVYYRYLIEEERRSGRGRTRWETVESGASSQPFQVEDETGAIRIDPDGAETILERDYRRVERGSGWLGRRTR
ncbi:MAG TPA: GIDE domain-containing protein, partial [Candidatus Polarisedimenticolia bacterium]|nr:GIDE domain-containing protein [Candidatus Polarisedimenticolia bacterium]